MHLGEKGTFHYFKDAIRGKGEFLSWRKGTFIIFKGAVRVKARPVLRS